MGACVSRSAGIFVVSLDLELFWGVHDFARLEDRRECLLRVRTLVPLLLRMFSEYGVHATWAAVGFLFFGTREELNRALPPCLPEYADPAFSPYARLEEIGENEQEDPYHFAPSLLRAIRDTANQEIGSHTFSHYYCLERAQNAHAFRSDLRAAAAAAQQLGVSLRSLVFPRNQVNPAYLDICREAGILAFRGTESSWVYSPRPRRKESQMRRLARALDCYCNVTGHHTYPTAATHLGPPVNVPSSRLMRPCIPALRSLEGLRLRRICSGMTYAARHGHIFHLWMHPEELAENPDENLGFLENILAHFRNLRQQEGMESLHMRAVAGRMLLPPQCSTGAGALVLAR